MRCHLLRPEEPWLTFMLKMEADRLQTKSSSRMSESSAHFYLQTARADLSQFVGFERGVNARAVETDDDVAANVDDGNAALL